MTHQQEQPDVASIQSRGAHVAGEAGHASAADVIDDPEREPAVNEYVVRVQCSSVTLFAFVLDCGQRFISFDQKPRRLTHDDALEIQDRLSTGSGTAALSIEQVGAREM